MVNLVPWGLLFVGRWPESCFGSPVRRLEFLDASSFSGKSAYLRLYNVEGFTVRPRYFAFRRCVQLNVKIYKVTVFPVVLYEYEIVLSR
jgi:hypothetical protein